MVESDLNYLGAMSERPYYYIQGAPEGERWRNTRGDRRRVPIHDARALETTPSLDREGFTLVNHRTAVPDLYDESQVRQSYYPEVEDLVLRATGAERVVVFDFNVRNAGLASDPDSGVQHPVRFVHNDYTLGSAPQRVRDLLEAVEAERRLGGRFAVINVWKPIRGPVEQNPLAFCDAKTMRQDQFIETELRYLDRTGEVYSVSFDSDHCWYYYPAMQEDEVLLLKCYDSDSSVARFTAHTSFDDPSSLPDAAPRESIEVRTLAFYSPEA